MRQRVDDELEKFHERMSGESESPEETARRDAAAVRSRERNLIERRRDYVENGLVPPESQHGIITSLPMMLKLGWTIGKDSDGNAVLVAPPKYRANAPRAGTATQEMGT